MFWSRLLLPAELAFVRQFFGSSLNALLPRIRLYQRRVGDTHRALSMNGGRLYLPRAFFEKSNPQMPLRLSHPVVAGIVGHELLHQWQRLQGQAVTRQALWLQMRSLCLCQNPYAYERCDGGQEMLETFLTASVEQQGQIWEDHVRTCVAGQPLPCLEKIAAWVRGEIPI